MSSGMGGIGQNLGGAAINKTLEAMKEVGKDTAREIQQESKDAMKAFLTGPQNVYARRPTRKQKTLKAQKSRVTQAKKAGEKGQRMLPIKQIKDTANRFQQRNPELRANVLSLLREAIKPGDTAEDILRKLEEFYPDPSLADEALEFLLETTEGALHQAVQDAKDLLNERLGREITAGRNIAEEARSASDKGLGTPTSMRDMYRDITGNPRDSITMFNELSNKYAYKDMQNVVKFLLHSLGADLKAKGPSIPRGLLHTLVNECRSLQAILGVYRFFHGRMGLVGKMFDQEGLEMPQTLTFETLAKQFMNLCGDRYPSSDKVLQTAVKLGVDKWIMAKIIALTQLRDAIRQVAMNKVFRSVQHRDEMYLAIIEALEDLEDELEELLEKEEEEAEDEEEEGNEEMIGESEKEQGARDTIE